MPVLYYQNDGDSIYRLFYDTIKAAFIQTGRSGQIIQKLSQGTDHPVLMKHEEGNYLKGLLIRVE